MKYGMNNCNNKYKILQYKHNVWETHHNYSHNYSFLIMYFNQRILHKKENTSENL